MEPERRKPKGGGGGGGKWLLTFNDLVTLLLTFFVLILSFSSMDSAKLKKMSQSVTEAFGLMNSGDMAEVRVFKPFVVPLGKKTLAYEQTKRKIAGYINEIGKMDAKVIENGVSVVLEEKFFFRTASADINPEIASNLNILADILKETNCCIEVEGHTDNIPIHGEFFQSNWELSMARAIKVVKFFIERGGILPERLSAAAYADSRPILPNDSDENRALNRRVEIELIMKRS